MANQTRTMEVQIKASDKTAQGTKSAGKNFKALATNIMAVSAALGAAAIVKSTQLWIRQEQAVKQLEIRLKSTGGVVGFTSKQLQAMAKELARTNVFTDEAIIGMQGMVASFTAIRGPEYKGALQATMDIAAAMAASNGGVPDLKAASIQVGKALNDPIKGVTALAEVGVLFTDGQREMINTLVRSGKTAQAQRIILKELSVEFGGSAQATGTGGAVTQFTKSLTTMSEAFGKGTTQGSGLNSTLKDLTGTLSDPELLKDIEMLGSALGTTVSWLIKIEALGLRIAKNNPLALMARGQSALEGAMLGAIGAGPRAMPGQLAEDGATATMVMPSVNLGPQMPGAMAAPAGIGGFGPTHDMSGFGDALSGITGLRDSLKTEEELITESYDNRLSIINDAAKAGLDVSGMKHQVDVEYETAFTKLAAREADKRRAKQQSTMQAIGSFSQNIFGAMANMAEEGSKKEFDANKKGAIASAVINTAQGATKAFSQWGWPWGAVMAAAVVAAGASQISKISGQEWDGGATGTQTISVNSGGAALDQSGQPVTQPVLQTGAESQGVSYNINVYGSIVDHDKFARELIQPLEKARIDGVQASL